MDGKIPTTALQKTIKALEQCDQELETLKAEHMEKCKRVREEKKDILETAKNQGLVTRAVKATVKVRSLQRKAGAEVEKLDTDDTDTYLAYIDSIASWDKTPLAQAMASQQTPAKSAKKAKAKKEAEPSDDANVVQMPTHEGSPAPH